MLHRDDSAFLTLRGRVSERFPLWPALALLAFTAGCAPKIGAACTVSTDCSAVGDRICDITQPGGYCTQFNCQPDTCPDDAACINFGTTLSVGDAADVPAACMSSQGNSPYQRSFCLASCESDGDCRPGYACIEPESIGGVKSDYDSFRLGKVCAVPRSTIDPTDAGNSDQVCTGSDAGSDAGLDAGSGGAGGTSGASGASSAGASGDAAAAGQAGAAGQDAGGMSGAENAGAGG